MNTYIQFVLDVSVLDFSGLEFSISKFSISEFRIYGKFVLGTGSLAMSEVRLVVQDQTGAKWGDFHGSTVSRVVGALAAEPETIPELAMALERYENHGKRLLHRGLHCGFRDDPWDAGIVMIDLPGRLLINESSYDHFEHSSSVNYHNGSSATNVKIRYQLPTDWMIHSSTDQWCIHSSRRIQRFRALERNSRDFVYGDGMLDFLIDRCYHSDALRRHVVLHDPTNTYALCKKIHLEWLQTPQNTLGGLSPREYMLDEVECIDADLWSRQEQWAITGNCPLALAEDSFAYEHAPMGSQEFYVYQYMIEFILECCVVRLPTVMKQSTESWDLVTERTKIRQLVDTWMHQPQDDFRGRTPKQIIDMERKRIPLTLSREETIIDCDCPLCNLMADLPGPAFWGIDGSGLPFEYPFSTFKSEAEWNSMMPGDADFEALPMQQDSSIRLGSGIPGSGNALASTVVVPNSALMVLVSVGFSLSDLITKVEDVDPSRNFIRTLNRHFDNVRAIVLEHGDNLSLLAPALERFEDSLQDIRHAHPNLTVDCDEVSFMLSSLLEFAD